MKKTFLSIVIIMVSTLAFANDNLPIEPNDFLQTEGKKNISIETTKFQGTDLGCVSRQTYEATIDYQDCSGVWRQSSARATCSATAETCEQAAYAASQCAFNAAYALIVGDIPNCPPA